MVTGLEKGELVRALADQAAEETADWDLMVEYPTVESVARLNEKYGGHGSVGLDLGGLEGAVARAQAAAFGRVRYPKLWDKACLLYTSPSPRDGLLSRMPSSA